MCKKIYTLILFICISFNFVAFSSSLTTSRDSLENILSTTTDPVKKIAIITDLSDIGLSLGDYSYTRREWDEAVKQNNINAIIESGSTLTLRYLNLAKMDSAAMWLEKCKKHFTGPQRESALIYLSLMSEIRDMGESEKMARRLINEEVNVKKNGNPYEKMKMLYQLGVLAIEDWNTNTSIKMKPWDSYMEEGLKIAQSLPLKDSYRFRHQFLMALSTMNVKSVEALLSLMNEYMALPEMANRKFYTHSTEIIAYSRMLRHPDEIGREKMDYYFNKFTDVATRYPHDCPSAFGFYYYFNAIDYYNYIKDYGMAVTCCDSVIANSAKNKMDNSYQYELRAKYLAKMGRYEDAYNASLKFVAIKDSITAAKTADKLMELQTQYDVDKYKYESAQHKIYFMWAAGVCLLLLALLVSLVFYNRLIRRKNVALVNRILSQEKAETQIEVEKSLKSENQLTSEEVMFRRIQKLLENKEYLKLMKFGRTEIAELLGTNVTYVANAVRACADSSVSEYINRMRVRYARQLLETDSDLSIEAIGDTCGFNSRSTFFAAFKNCYDITPGDFRRALKTKKLPV